MAKDSPNLKVDPAFEAWAEARTTNITPNFRWTRRTMRQAFVFVVAFPLAVYYVSSKYDKSVDWSKQMRNSQPEIKK
ncbi:6879_t:CDS:2 [Ambispora gerdemannii]|uniref:NADH dehydrogenase [ubiquinone] 1 beta subcomplex subunit 4 n=1 Tax=Ambispora gerdemannii TaxID=144530 RepID=A0A9N8ZDY8_9GLOM|nr:6879_t:CDS:2 [Ambispora gerdemannii]